ncbi:DUF1801 domain-containing protein [Fulvivirga sp. RKSG066]|uniref:DUF1801 domain-containing protein n=1 Tax=Fulvivirga aurantia TaxID=2529383 RepID=UPI0012BC81F6|nr:DUF1801 domain-containing protein [Fulvivirga aurantia]MTI21002.1 DUF1801 domain-containing protein [Fulvivirga aurantia]
MAELKTKINDSSVTDFLNSVEDEGKREDSYRVLEIMKEITGEEPKMWGTSIVGFGSYHYKYESGREGDWFVAGFSPRKQAITLYIMSGFSKYDELMSKLGKYKTGKSCLYIKKLSDVDEEVLKELITTSVNYISNLESNK